MLKELTASQYELVDAKGKQLLTGGISYVSAAKRLMQADIYSVTELDELIYHDILMYMADLTWCGELSIRVLDKVQQPTTI